MNELLLQAMNGAKQVMRAQSVNANNLANLSTDGFRAELTHIANLADGMVGSPDLAPGIVRTTGNSLDISINGKGWIAVMSADGSEGYSRRGDMRVDALGQLTDGAGNPILGNSGPIALPPFEAIEIAKDGTISIQPLGQAPNTMATLDRIKLVLPVERDLQRGEDGMMRLQSGENLKADASVQIFSGTLEGSNVNSVGEMVKMIDLARQFESQIQLMQTDKENSSALAKLLGMN